MAYSSRSQILPSLMTCFKGLGDLLGLLFSNKIPDIQVSN